MKKFTAGILSAMLFIGGFQAVASTDSFNQSIPEASAASNSFSHKVKCPVMKINNEGTGKYIYGYGKDKKAAIKNANDKLGQQFGRGFKLKHCLDLGKFSGGGGSGEW